MSLRRPLLALLTTVALTALAPSARAHTVTVDGLTTDWSARGANPAGARNAGIVIRNAQSEGEFIWDDALGDARTDLSGGGPEPQADIARVQVTGTAQGLFLLVNAGAPSSSGDPVQVMFAIDTNRVSGSGTIAMPGFSATDVSANAAWERVIRTRLRGANPGVDVLDAAYQLVAPTAANPPRIARGATGSIEIFVPWSMLGLNNTPGALRFTVASFREQANGDVTQFSTQPYALDVVSNYGDPRAANYLNTFEEFNNPRSNTLDYAFDVYFDPNGEVRSPMLITRVVPTSTASAWVELTLNTAMTGLGSNDFKISNAPVIDGSLTTMRVPGGLSFGTLRLAQSGPGLMSQFGFAASAEWTSASTSVPDMTPYTPWSTGTNFALSAGGDVLLVLDRADTVVDVLTWGTGAFAGVTRKNATASNNTAFVRGANDTDDCELDFTVSTPSGDAGVGTDAGTSTDAGLVDVVTDIGLADVGVDTGTAIDTGTGTDTGTNTDTGTGTDTGTSTDTGTAMDAGTTADTGTSTDGGTSTTDVVRRDVPQDVGSEPTVTGGCACTTAPGHANSAKSAKSAIAMLLVGVVLAMRTRRRA